MTADQEIKIKRKCRGSVDFGGFQIKTKAVSNNPVIEYFRKIMLKYFVSYMYSCIGPFILELQNCL